MNYTIRFARPGSDVTEELVIKGDFALWREDTSYDGTELLGGPGEVTLHKGPHTIIADDKGVGVIA